MNTLTLIRKLRAFSLLEIIMVLVLLAVLLMMAMPFTQSFSDKHLLNTRVKRMQSVVSYSLNQAITQERSVVLAPLVKNDWSKGMRLFVDKNANHRYQPGDEVLREWRFNDAKLSMSWHGFLSDNYLVFSVQMAQSVLNGRFILKNHAGEVVKQLVINSLGRVRVE